MPDIDDAKSQRRQRGYLRAAKLDLVSTIRGELDCFNGVLDGCFEEIDDRNTSSIGLMADGTSKKGGSSVGRCKCGRTCRRLTQGSVTVVLSAAARDVPLWHHGETALICHPLQAQSITCIDLLKAIPPKVFDTEPLCSSTKSSSSVSGRQVYTSTNTPRC
jgi:hypothetical protein